MEIPKLSVVVKVEPHPDTVPPEVMDKMLDGELVEFEKWFIGQQRSRGGAGTPLIHAEKAIVKSYVLYLASKQ